MCLQSCGVQLTCIWVHLAATNQTFSSALRTKVMASCGIRPVKDRCELEVDSTSWKLVRSIGEPVGKAIAKCPVTRAKEQTMAGKGNRQSGMDGGATHDSHHDELSQGTCSFCGNWGHKRAPTRKRAAGAANGSLQKSFHREELR